MKISVIVTNYNHAQYIEQAVRSIINQTYDDLEIVIVDDCSTDGSQKLIKKICNLDSRILEPIFLTENKGKWFALNYGIGKRTSGKLLTLQDADDTSCPQRLELQLKTLIASKSYHTLCGFHNCGSQVEMNKAEKFTINIVEPLEQYVMGHKETLQNVYTGHNSEGINHYFTGKFETHGASSLFYKQHWEHGMKFMPGNMNLRCQKAEDSDHNTKMTLLLQKTSIIKVPLYCYRRGSTTNGAYLEEL